VDCWIAIDLWKPEGSMHREEIGTGKTHEQVGEGGGGMMRTVGSP
jgi:hypothetical protein